jgi:hypothetical protein
VGVDSVREQEKPVASLSSEDSPGKKYMNIAKNPTRQMHALLAAVDFEV